MGILMQDFQSSLEELNDTQQRMLLLLTETDQATMTNASQMMNLEKGSMTPVVDKLISLGYLLRERNLEDRRQVLLHLTEKGRQAADALRVEVEVHMAQKFLIFTDDERAELWRSFQNLAQIVERLERGR
jgi:DNA-binding MarR family transcriptional regulator